MTAMVLHLFQGMKTLQAISGLLVSFLYFLFAGSVGQAMETPLRDPEKLWEAKTETVLAVKTARVIVADYDLLRKDFKEISAYNNEQIDQWLIKNAAYISKEQVAQTKVNTPITTGEQTRLAYRPREYRRAHVFVADTGGLIDAKGTGAVDPSGGSHDNGLATLGDMIREYSYEKLINAIFQRDGRYETVGSYGVLDLGFDIKHPDGGRSRAGVVLRQAHTRYHDGPMGKRHRGQPTMLPSDFQKEVELFLRQFGVTSTLKGQNREIVNIQGADTFAIIDFGSFMTERQFTKEVYFFYDAQGNGYHNVESLVTKPGQESFVQVGPKPIPFDIWGYSQSGKADSKYDNPYIWSHELAQSLAEGRASRDHVNQHLKNLFDRAEMQLALSSIAPSCRGIFRK